MPGPKVGNSPTAPATISHGESRSAIDNPKSPRQASASAAGFDDLPHDVYATVLGHLDAPADVAHFALLSPHSRKAATTEPTLRRYIDRQAGGSSDSPQLPRSAALLARAHGQNDGHTRRLLNDLQQVRQRMQNWRLPAVSHCLLRPGGSVRPLSLRWSRCGEFVTFAAGGQVHVMRLADGQATATNFTARQSGSLAWAGQPSRLIGAAPAGRGVEIFTPQTGETATLGLQAAGRLAKIDAAPRGSLVALRPRTASPAQSVTVADLANSSEVLQLERGAPLLAVEWSPSGRCLAVQWGDGKTSLLTFAAGRPPTEHTISSHPAHAMLAWSEEDNLAVSGPDGHTQIYAADGTLRSHLDRDHRLAEVTWDSAADKLAGATADGEVRLYSRAPDDERRFGAAQSLKLRGEAIAGLRLSPGSRSVTYDRPGRPSKTIAVDPQAATVRRSLRSQSSSWAVTSPDGQWDVEWSGPRQLSLRSLDSLPIKTHHVQLGDGVPDERPSQIAWSPEATRLVVTHEQQVTLVDLTRDAT